jgi:Uncharacterized conserved protein related to MYG1 family
MKRLNDFYTTAVTHNGIFHSDDVFSTALLQLINPDIVIKRVSEVPTDLGSDTIVFDIGFGEFDHHQPDTPVRDNGIKYAAFGLLWRKYGHLLVSDCSVASFDSRFIQPLDDSDNGGPVNLMSSTISSFAPLWDDENQDMDIAFDTAVVFATNILSRQIESLNSIVRAKDYVRAAFDNSDGDIVVMDRFLPWQDVLISTTAKFVVFPSLRGGYAAQAIPSTLGGRDQKIPFLDEEVLRTDNLLCDNIVFCHKGKFLVNTKTIDSAVLACRKSLYR